MRYIITQSSTLYLLLFCVVIFSVSCKRNQHIQGGDKKTLSFNRQQSDTTKLFRARLTASFCAFHIVQIEDSAFYSYGMNWTNAEGKEYQHVFSIKNHCDFMNANVKTGEIFTCSIVDKAAVSNCSFCEGFLDSPPLRHNIRVVM